jgi:hypothetical protein
MAIAFKCLLCPRQFILIARAERDAALQLCEFSGQSQSKASRTASDQNDLAIQVSSLASPRDCSTYDC